MRTRRALREPLRAPRNPAVTAPGGAAGDASYDGAAMVSGTMRAEGDSPAAARIVTGAARGIGAEIAATFAGEGAAVGLLDVARRQGRRRRARRRRPRSSTSPTHGDPRALSRLIVALGGVDVLVNNAGILRSTPLLDITVEEWDLVMDVNVRSMLVTTQVAAAR